MIHAKQVLTITLVSVVVWGSTSGCTTCGYGGNREAGWKQSESAPPERVARGAVDTASSTSPGGAPDEQEDLGDAANASGARMTEDENMLGASKIDVVDLELTIDDPGAGGEVEHWIVLGAVKFPGSEPFRRAALDLTDAILSSGFVIGARSELNRVVEGAIWPPNSVRFKVYGQSSDANEDLRTLLMERTIDTHDPVGARPDGYGTFFVQCGQGDRDLWTVWYP